MKMSLTQGSAPMLFRSITVLVVSSVNPLGVFSQTSNKPSSSLSCTVVLNTMAPHDRQSKDPLPWSTLVITEGVSPLTKALTSKVKLSHEDPGVPPALPANGLGFVGSS